VIASKILDMLMQRLGNKTEPELRASCVLEMQMVQEVQLEGGPVLPWFLIKDTDPAAFKTVASDRRVGVPTDFIRETEQPLYLINDQGAHKKLNKKTWDDMVENFGLEATGEPDSYDVIGDNFQLFPIPLKVYVLDRKYYARQTTPSDSGTLENGWMKWAPDLLLATTGTVMASQYVQSMEMAGVFAGMVAAAQTRLHMMNTAREEAARDRAMG
jgi:hypothetical protein